MRLAFESVDSVKWIVLLNVSGIIQSVEDLNGTKGRETKNLPPLFTARLLKLGHLIS